MQETLSQVIAELRSAWRFRWQGVIAAWVVAIVGWTGLMFVPDVYEARARVYVDMSSILRPLLHDSIIPSDVPTRLAYVRQALLGQTYLERIATENGFYGAGADQQQRELILGRLRSTVEVEAVAPSPRDTNANQYSMFNITYRDPSPTTALGVVRTLLNSLIEDTLSGNRDSSDAAARFLDERIREYENRLQQKDQELAEFQRSHSNRLPGQEGSYFERMQRERDALANTERDLRLAESKRTQIEQQLANETPVTVVNDLAQREPPPNSIDARIRDARAQLDRLLLDYTDKHPDVIALRETLGRLEQQRLESLRELGINNPEQQLSTLGSSAVYQASQIALNEVRVQIATLQTDIADRKRRLAELQGLIDEVPQVEADLQRLTRDYEDIRKQYQVLVQSRETQALSSKAAEADQVEFQVLDPPSVGFQPAAPPRLLLTAGVLGAALVVGAALCWLLAQLKPVFTSGRTLGELTGLPVLGTVRRVAVNSLDKSRRRYALASFGAAVAGLVLVFGVVVLVETAGPGMRGLFLGG